MRLSVLSGATLSLGSVGFVAAQGAECPNGLTIIELQPAQIVAEQPVWIDAFFPNDYEIPIRDDLTITVTGAPTSIVTDLTYVRAYSTTFTK